MSVRRLTVIGSVLGLMPALGMGVRLYQTQEPVEALVLGSLYASPYLLVLAIVFMPGHAARGGLLLALGMVSLFASFSSLAGVGLALLPATGVILYVSVWSIRLGEHQWFRAFVFFLSSLLASAVVISLSLYILVTK